MSTNALQEHAPAIDLNLFDHIAIHGKSLISIIWDQQRFHESRRWSATELVNAIDLTKLSDGDRVRLAEAGKAELTTKPGADRLARLADAECRRFAARAPHVAAVFQALGTWSRYWNEEEAFHESALNILALRAGCPAVSDELVIEYRRVFPDDDALRTLMLLAISEINAQVSYARCARESQDPALAELFRRIAADEAQHMAHFIAFARALVRSSTYTSKEALAVAHMFVRPGGELEGSQRTIIEPRATHVNWWDHLSREPHADSDLEKKRRLVYAALRQITGISVRSPEEVENAWLEQVG